MHSNLIMTNNNWNRDKNMDWYEVYNEIDF